MIDPVSITEKLDRIGSGARPRVLDLFAGCGGISLGFLSAGCEITCAVEIDPPAAKSHAMNFHPDLSGDAFEAHARPRNIVDTEPHSLVNELLDCNGRIDRQLDIIVGGPPCQSFARVGRAKLREVAAHPEAYLQDPRRNLYLRYLHYVKALAPVALLMENVPDVLNVGGHNIPEEICEALQDLGYKAKYTLLNAVFYGVPQMRERMFLVAFREEIEPEQWFPFATHWIELPVGYNGSRQVALQSIKDRLFRRELFYTDPPKADKDKCFPAVTAREALSDLPVITDHLKGLLKKGPRHFTEPVPYPSGLDLTYYQCVMRKWQGFEAGSEIRDHVIRYLPRDYAIFKRMNPGDQYPEAHLHAMALFREKISAHEKASGVRLKEGDENYEKILRETVPPYDPGKFPNKWRKMEEDLPARTLMAHLGKDSYSHIHYDSRQARTISVREAARLQSFPDGFTFQGPMNPAFRQIGNAVPPLMAKALAETMLKQIGATNAKTQNCAEAVNCR